MEAGEVFAISLDGPTGAISLGEAAVTGEGEDANAGFTTTFTVPTATAPGSYTLRAATEAGETATADLTVTAPSEQASIEPVMVEEPTGELHQLDRSKPLSQVIAAVVVIALSAAAGFVLVRSRG
jgi:hypothetical protein